jgi:hypothetical protein
MRFSNINVAVKNTNAFPALLTDVSSGTASKPPEAHVLQVFVAGGSSAIPSTAVVSEGHRIDTHGKEYLGAIRTISVYGATAFYALSSTAMGDPAISTAPVGALQYQPILEPLYRPMTPSLTSVFPFDVFRVRHHSASAQLFPSLAVDTYAKPRTKLAEAIVKYREAARREGKKFRSIDEILADLERARRSLDG